MKQPSCYQNTIIKRHNTISRPQKPLFWPDSGVICSFKMDLGILRVLLVRHGMSEDNQNAIWAGHRDSPLSTIGVNQAKALGASLADYSFQGIYSSDLKRASSTAEAILSVNRSKPPPPLVQTQSLREQNFGQAEGRNWNDAELISLTSNMMGEDARIFKFPEGESLEDVNARMAASLRRYVFPRLEALRSGTERGEPQIVIVAHGIAIAEMLRVLIGLHDASDNGPWPDPHESYKRVRLENTGWTLVELAVPHQDLESTTNNSLSESVQRRVYYVRIVQQNVTDHLRGSLLPPQSQHTTPLTGGASTPITAGSLLGGGSGGNAIANSDSSHTLASTNDGHTSPSVAFLTLRPIIPSKARDEIDRSTGLLGSSVNSTSNQATSPGATLANILIPSSVMISGPGAWNELWQTLCFQVVTLFNSEDPRTMIEEVNENVSDHVRRCLERSPARASDALSKDLYALCTTGISVLNTKLEQITESDDVRLLESLVDLWKRFHWRILPYLEAFFIPLQTDATLISLTRGGDNPNSSLRTEPINVSRIILMAFRDQLLLTRSERLFMAFVQMDEMEKKHKVLLANGTSKVRSSDNLDDILGNEGEGYDGESQQIYPRLAQMTHLLAGVQSQDEKQQEMEGLVRALRAGHENKFEDKITVKAAGVTGLGLGNSSLTADLSNGSGLMSRNAKRAQARQGWLPKSASKKGNLSNTNNTESIGEANANEEFGKSSNAVAGKEESIFLSSLRSPTIAEDEAAQDSNLAEVKKIPNFIDDEIDDSIHDHSQSGSLADSSFRTQESANIGLGLPMDQMNDTTFG